MLGLAGEGSLVETALLMGQVKGSMCEGSLVHKCMLLVVGFHEAVT